MAKSTPADSFDLDPVPAPKAIRSAGLAELIAEVKAQKEREEKAKVATACLDLYNKAEERRAALYEQYKVARAACEKVKDDLKNITKVVEEFEQTCDPLPLLEVMGEDVKAFYSRHNIK